MKKLLILTLGLTIVLGLSNCKKEEDNSGDNTTPQETCFLKSVKEEIKITGNPTKYEGFVYYYNNDNTIARANFIDSVTGNEDSLTYVLFSYNDGNVSTVKLIQGTNNITVNLSYNANNKVTQRTFDFSVPGIKLNLLKNYFYDNQGRISHAVGISDVEIPNFGNTISKDSAIYQAYNSSNRPTNILIYNSVTTSQGTTPYSFGEEIKYEYDANGNRTKTSTKNAINAPFNVTYEASFDLEKTLGAAKDNFNAINNLITESWDDISLTSADKDKNIVTTETDYTENLNGKTTTKTYVYNDKGNPIEFKEASSNTTSTSTLTYECK